MHISVVTGVSSGIGASITARLLKENWKVYGLSRSKPRIQNSNFIWLRCDLADQFSLPGALEEIYESNIDLLVSNAGVAFEEPAIAVSEQSYKKVYDVNVLAPMLIVRALKGKIVGATIISISSISDRLVGKNYALYCSSKAANTRYFETLAEELKDVNVITLLPDYVDTPMLRRLQEGRDFAWTHVISVEDIAKLAVNIANKKLNLASGSNIIVVNNHLLNDLHSVEKLYSYNVDTEKCELSLAHTGGG